MIQSNFLNSHDYLFDLFFSLIIYRITTTFDLKFEPCYESEFYLLFGFGWKILATFVVNKTQIMIFLAHYSAMLKLNFIEYLGPSFYSWKSRQPLWILRMYCSCVLNRTEATQMIKWSFAICFPETRCSIKCSIE